jgi:GST-like protein
MPFGGCFRGHIVDHACPSPDRLRLFWQVGGLGQMAGQIGHFNIYAPAKVPYAIERYSRETSRLYGVLDGRLADREFLAGEYSIADMACYPWIVPHKAHGQDLAGFRHLRRWFEAIAARPATIRAYEGVRDTYAPQAGRISEEERRILFGSPSSSRSKRPSPLPGSSRRSACGC